jgi:hypothetical protein
MVHPATAPSGERHPIHPGVARPTHLTDAVLLSKELIDAVACNHLAFRRPDVQFQI